MEPTIASYLSYNLYYVKQRKKQIQHNKNPESFLSDFRGAYSIISFSIEHPFLYIWLRIPVFSHVI